MNSDNIVEVDFVVNGEISNISEFSIIPARAVDPAYRARVEQLSPPVAYLTIARRGGAGIAISSKHDVITVKEQNVSDFPSTKGDIRTPFCKRKFLDVNGRPFDLAGYDRKSDTMQSQGAWPTPMLFDFHTVPLWSLSELAEMLDAPLHAPMGRLPFPRVECSFVNEAVVDPAGDGFRKQAQRLKDGRSAKARTGRMVTAPPALVAMVNRLHWIDIDGVDLAHYRPGMDRFPVLDWSEIERLVRDILPEWLASAELVLQLTASHAIKGLRVRVFYMIDEPRSVKDMQQVWSAHTLEYQQPPTGDRYVDGSGFNPIQITYISTTFEKATVAGKTSIRDAKVQFAADPLASIGRIRRLDGAPFAMVPDVVAFDDELDEVEPATAADKPTRPRRTKVATGAADRRGAPMSAEVMERRAALDAIIASGDDEKALALIHDAEGLHQRLLDCATALLRMQPARPLSVVEGLMKARAIVVADRLTRSTKDQKVISRAGRVRLSATAGEIENVIRSRANILGSLLDPSEGSKVAYAPGLPTLSVDAAGKVIVDAFDRVLGANAIELDRQWSAVKQMERDGADTADIDNALHTYRQTQTAPVTVLSVSTGVGKTHLLAKWIAENRRAGRVGLIIVADHKVGQQFEAMCQKLGVAVVRVEGMERACTRIAVHADPIPAQFQGAKGDMRKFCGSCPFRRTCPKMEQEARLPSAEVVIAVRPDQWFQPLPAWVKVGSDVRPSWKKPSADELKRSYAETGSSDAGERMVELRALALEVRRSQFAWVAIDECLPANWIEKIAVDVGFLDKWIVCTSHPLMPEAVKVKLAEPLNALSEVLVRLRDRIVAAEDGRKITFEDAPQILRDLRRLAQDCYWRADVSEELHDGDGDKPSIRLIKAQHRWCQDLDLIGDLSDAHLDAALYVEGDGARRTLTAALRRKPHYTYRAPTVIMDATANRAALECFAPNLDFIEARAVDGFQSRRLHMTGGPAKWVISGSTFKDDAAKPRFRGVQYRDGMFRPALARDEVAIELEEPGKKRGAPQKHQADIGPTVVNFLRYLSAGKRDGVFFDAQRSVRVGVVCQKVLEDALQDVEGLDVQTLHFGKQRGQNELEGVDRLVVLGAALPRVDDLALIAEALSGERLWIVPTYGETQQQWREVYVRNGDRIERHHAPVLGFGNKWLQIAFDVTVTAELLQADGRGRSVRRDADAWIDVIHVSNVGPLPGLVYDVLDAGDMHMFDPKLVVGRIAQRFADGERHETVADWNAALGMKPRALERGCGHYAVFGQPLDQWIAELASGVFDTRANVA